jgi:hypothetical protein
MSGPRRTTGSQNADALTTGVSSTGGEGENGLVVRAPPR